MRRHISSAVVVLWAMAVGVPPAFAQSGGARQTARETQQGAKETAGKAGRAVSDSWITGKIYAQFVPEESLEGSDINVDTRAGLVSLSGTVRTEAGRSRAVAIARATDGVKRVNDKLRVAPDHAGREAGRTGGEQAQQAGREAARDTKETAGTAGRTVTDGWIKSKIYAQYVTDEALDGNDITIQVTKGIVTLRGTVPAEAARARALSIAKATDGVKSVKDQLKVARASR